MFPAVNSLGLLGLFCLLMEAKERFQGSLAGVGADPMLSLAGLKTSVSFAILLPRL